jgi:tetratricopeptide (TPR) repeat protein
MALDKNAVIKEAQKFAAKGQFDKAIAEWKKIAKETPDDANIFNTIGDLCLKKNSKPEAVEAYKKAGDILASDGFTSKAIALYKKVLNIDPKKIEAHLALADLNAEKGLTGNALESYKVVADHYTKNNEKNKALGIYQKMADLNPSNVAFRLKLADMYAKEGMKPEAVKAYLQAADVHVSKEAFKEARQLFEKALALDPNNKEVYHKAGFVYYKEGKFVEACKALKPAFEGDPKNDELRDLYLDALSKAGRGPEAAEVYQKLLTSDPDRHDIREKLYQLFLGQHDFDKAFSEVSSLANAKIESKDLDGAEQLLREFITQAPRHVEGRRALSALFKTVGKGDEAAGELVRAAEILLDEGDTEGAKDILAKATELAPDHAEAKQMLERLQPAPPQHESPSAGSEEAPESAELQQAAPAFDPAEWTPPPAPQQPTEDPAVVKALQEIEVLVKYGLATKALEQLESLALKFPANIQVRLKLRDLYGDQGNMGKAVAHMLILADLHSQQGRDEEAQQVLEAAQGMDPRNPQLLARLGSAAPAPQSQASQVFVFPEPAGQPPLPDQAVPSFDHPPLTDFGHDSGFPGDSLDQEAAFKEQATSPVPEELSFDHPFTVPDLPVEKEQVFPEDAAGLQEEPQQPAAPSPMAEEIDISEIWAEAEFYYQQGLFDEARKHYEKIVEYAPDNAQARSRIAEIEREQEQSQEFSKLAEAVDGLEGLDGYVPPAPDAPAGDMASSASDEEAVRSLMQEIAQLKQKSAPPRAPETFAFPPAEARETKETVPFRTDAYPAQERPEEDFFDLGAELNQITAAASTGGPAPASSPASDDFFDLASELRDELSAVSVPAPSSSPEDQSLDDIFEDFKKGVEEQAVKEDADTHYNLGIAYKEMGLLDDAIGEFIMTPEDEPKFVQSRYMLGLCYMEKGDFQNAIAEIGHALSSAERFGLTAGDTLGMSYDLGLACQGAGNQDSALQEFQKVYVSDPGYRDVADKIRDLQQGDVISLEQLRDDIEKEISFKFLEEGERIEREEKTRKNERVRR